MLLTCPHCTDVAEIPNIFRTFYGMPIACHACMGVFYVPQRLVDSKGRSVRQHHQNVRCTSCRVTLIAPAVKRLAKDDFSMLCPACKADIPASQISHRRFHLLRSENLLPVFLGGCIGASIVYLNQRGMLGDYPDIMLIQIQNLLESIINIGNTTFRYLNG